jgi:formylglycine-generating enzyme required for sulfatase activity
MGDPSQGATASSGAAGSGATAGSTTAGSGASGGTSSAGGSFDCAETADPGELVAIPAGEFSMGCNAEVDDQCEDDENPMHVVMISAFEIERTEVTQARYTACVAEGACAPPSCVWDCGKADMAASCVNFEQALDYCAWAGRRLPTEAEWEKAARGTEGLKYPWGNTEPDCTLANMARCADDTMLVGTLTEGASPYGVLDLAGNMVEMVADWYDATYYAESPTTDPTGPASGQRYVGRGGGFKSDAEWLRTSKRDWYDLTDAGASLGFRCAR